MDPWSAAIGIGGLISSFTSAKSSSEGMAAANASNERIAKDNRDFQERMSNTAHEREVKDLRTAGLNPILSATGGSGASSPGGSTATMQNTKEQSANILSNSAKAAADLVLTKELAKTEKSKQVLNEKSADKLGGTVPGTDIPINRVANLLSNIKTKFSAKNANDSFSKNQTNLKSQGVKTWFN